jgi:tetratricopeptide (TPR) repeat protein
MSTSGDDLQSAIQVVIEAIQTAQDGSPVENSNQLQAALDVLLASDGVSTSDIAPVAALGALVADFVVAPGDIDSTVRSARRLTAASRFSLPDDLLAPLMGQLGIRLSELGRRDEALTPTQEATDLYRQLADTNPAAYLPDLAMSLNNLGARLSELGRRDEALTPTQEAVNIRRQLADTNPAAYLPDLANG